MCKASRRQSEGGSASFFRVPKRPLQCCACAGAGALSTGEACDVDSVLLCSRNPFFITQLGAHLSHQCKKCVPLVARCVSFASLERLITGRSLVDVFPSFARAGRLRLLGLP
jgi:hypothetical protein